MENCLVTILKGEFSIENPRYFNSLHMHSYTPTYFTLKGSNTYSVGGTGVKIILLSNNAEIRVESNPVAGNEYTMKATDNLIRVHRTTGDEAIEFLLEGLSLFTAFDASVTETFVNNWDDMNNIAPTLRPYNGAAALLKAKKGTGIIGDANWIKNIGNKQGFTGFHLASSSVGENLNLDLSSLSNFTDLTLLPVGGMNYSGSLSSISGLTALTKVQFGGQQKVQGNLSDLTNLVNLTVIEVNTTQVVGDIVSLGALTSLVTLYLTNQSMIEGTVESLVAAQYTAGRKSASGSSRIKIFAAGSKVKFNNTLVNATKYIAWDDGGSAPSNIRLENS